MQVTDKFINPETSSGSEPSSPEQAASGAESPRTRANEEVRPDGIGTTTLQAEAEPSFGYVGKILRLDLTDGSTQVVPTSNYYPTYLGGRAICNKIFWDDVAPGVGAFDPENELIFMTGPTTGTGIPTGGRCVFTGIAPNSLPEQYAWSGIGGWFGAELKFAGFDGFVLLGKAPVPSYVLIDDGVVQVLPAEGLWGLKVHDAQRWIQDRHGRDVQSVVIGPAGENLMRNASITTSNDNVAAKAGFGAVMGSKNLKAVAVHGTGVVRPYDVAKVYELRQTVGAHERVTNPIANETTLSTFGDTYEVEGGYQTCHTACSYGCNQRCSKLMLGMHSAFSEERVNQIEKCVGIFAYGFENDCSWFPMHNYGTEKNNMTISTLASGWPMKMDTTDPYAGELFVPIPGDKVNYWKDDFAKGGVMMDLCNEYGIDKWDVIVWFFTWLSMAKQEGLLGDLDFGREVDVDDVEFVKYFLDMITYRKGKLGPVFAEGMARAIRTLGKEKYGDAIYHNRWSQVIDGKRLDIPVSLESAWGHCVHWQGRGYHACIDKGTWVPVTLELMLSTRDAQTAMHHHDNYEWYKEVRKDPYHHPRTPDAVIFNEIKSEIKDSVTSCEHMCPDINWEDQELQMYYAATGIKLTLEEFYRAADRSKMLFRAIIMRNHGRDRQMETSAVFPILTYPDPWGEVAQWDDWNYLVDAYYTRRGWDLATGWPYRATWEAVGLGEVADELDALGKLPADPGEDVLARMATMDDVMKIGLAPKPGEIEEQAALMIAAEVACGKEPVTSASDERGAAIGAGLQSSWATVV